MGIKELIKELHDAQPTHDDGSNALEAFECVTRRAGKWIDDNCSVCGFYVYHGDARNFCPNCGSKMEVDNAQEEKE